MTLKKHIYLLSFLALLAGCASDDAPVIPDTSDSGCVELSASVYATPTRSGVTTTENIQEFLVSAYNVVPYENWTDYKMLMINTPVRRVALNEWDYSPKIQWPEKDSLRFFAISPVEGNRIHLNPWSGTWAENTGYDPKVDLVVCTRFDFRRNGQPVPLNFVHAMARVQLRLAADVPGEKVYICAADLINMRMGSQFYFPSVTTASPSSADITRCWLYLNGIDYALHPYFQGDAAKPVLLTGSYEEYTNTGNQFEAPYPFSQLMVDSETGRHFTGQAIRLTVRFVDSKTGRRTWPNDSTPIPLLLSNYGDREWGYVFFPLYGVAGMTTFESGKSYVFDVMVRRHGVLPPIAAHDDNDSTASSPSGRRMDLDSPLPAGRYRSASTPDMTVTVGYF